jgi:hypothetical protein
MTKPTKTADGAFVLELLKKIQAGQVEVRNSMADVRRDVRSMKDEIVSLRTIMGEFVKSDARREGDYLNLATRVERIEHRLDVQDRPS